jgi:uncharacterized membrane protein SpoIIM required for sporulation
MKMKIDLAFWTKASTMHKRIYTFLFILVVAIILTAVSALVPISHNTATQIYNQLNESVSQQKASGTVPQYIFLNNFRICLIMFIPIVGPAFGVVSFVSTGYDLGGISRALGISPPVYMFAEFFNPIFWIEFTAYSVAIAESIWLYRRLMQKRYGELKNAAILIGVCAVLLAVGAIVESMLPLV